MYAASENFKNTIRFALEFNDEINEESLFYAVQMVQKRYPYFSVKMEKEGEDLILTENDLPFVISDGNKAVCLNSPESNYHILAFAWQGNVISADISHNVCDGNGIAPMQPGKNPEFVNELIKTFEEAGIDCVLTGEEHFTLSDFALE